MKFYKGLLGIYLSLIAFGCAEQNVVDAKIFERKEVEGDKLQIKYRYTVKGNEYSDSSIIKNIPLGGDVVPVKFNHSDPGNATPQLDKE